MGERRQELDVPRERKHGNQPVKGIRFHAKDICVSSCSQWGARALGLPDFSSVGCY